MILFQADPINHFSSKILLLLLKMKAIQTSSDWNSEKEGEKNQYRIFQGTISAFEKRPLITCLRERQPVAQSAFRGELNGWISGKPLKREIAEKSKLTGGICSKLTQGSLRTRSKMDCFATFEGILFYTSSEFWDKMAWGQRGKNNHQILVIHGLVVFPNLVH